MTKQCDLSAVVGRRLTFVGDETGAEYEGECLGYTVRGDGVVEFVIRAEKGPEGTLGRMLWIPAESVLFTVSPAKAVRSGPKRIGFDPSAQ